MQASFVYASRLNSYKFRPDLFEWNYGPSDIRDLIRRANQVSELNAVVLNYPEHFENNNLSQVEDAISDTSLVVGGINMRYPEPLFLEGAFTNPDPNKRRAAIEITQQAVDICRRLGAPHLVIWLGYDGFDYPFQLDYARAWDWTIDGIRTVADYAGDLKISIEYKPADPRRFSLIGDVGTTLLAIEECNRPNIGVTLDFCHMLMAKESPAMAAALCHRHSRLFGLHLNDGYGSLDDGLMVGSVNLTQTIELIYYMVASGYDDIVYFDTFPVREDPVKECAANIQRVNRMVSIATKIQAQNAGHHIDRDEMRSCMGNQDGLCISQILWEALFPP